MYGRWRLPRRCAEAERLDIPYFSPDDDAYGTGDGEPSDFSNPDCDRAIEQVRSSALRISACRRIHSRASGADARSPSARGRSIRRPVDRRRPCRRRRNLEHAGRTQTISRGAHCGRQTEARMIGTVGVAKAERYSSSIGRISYAGSGVALFLAASTEARGTSSASLPARR